MLNPSPQIPPERSNETSSFGSNDSFGSFSPPPPPSRWPDGKTILKHLGLFLLTLASVTYVGAMWVGQTANAESFTDLLPEGFLFAVLLLSFLGVHEFGHYFAGVYHRIDVTLPYFIPLPLGIGTMGAIIRIREQIKTTRKLFDMGISGPLAGFVVSLGILLYGFATLPPPTFIENFAGHEEVVRHVQQTGEFPEKPVIPQGEAEVIVLGNTLLFSFIASFFEDVPPMYELYHYPFLFAGWLGLFFTALNLMPLGQLDGGHILYSLIGPRRHRVFARVFFGGFTVLAGIEAISFMDVQLGLMAPGFRFVAPLVWAGVLFFLLRRAYDQDGAWVMPVWFSSLVLAWLYLLMSDMGFGFGADDGSPAITGSMIWVVWSFFLVYFVRIQHPPVMIEEPLDRKRKVLGWLSMLILILCISPAPIGLLS